MSVKKSERNESKLSVILKAESITVYTIEITGNIVGNWNLDFVAQKDGAEEVFHYPITVV